MIFKASCLSALFNWHWLPSFFPLELNLICLAQTSLFTDFSFTTEASFMLPIHSRHYNRVQESRLRAELFLAFSIDRYLRIFLDMSHFCDTRSAGKLIDLLISVESFSVPTKTLVSLLRAQTTRRTSHLVYYVFFQRSLFDCPALSYYSVLSVLLFSSEMITLLLRIRSLCFL